MKKKQKVIYWDVGGESEVYFLTPEYWDKYLKLYDALQEETLTWRQYKKILDDDWYFDYVYNKWLDSRDFGENFRDLVNKIQQSIDISKEKNFDVIEYEPIHWDEIIPDQMWFYDNSIELGNHPSVFLRDSLPEEVIERYLSENYSGGPGCSSSWNCFRYEDRHEIVKALQSIGYTVERVHYLPF